MLCVNCFTKRGRLLTNRDKSPVLWPMAHLVGSHAPRSRFRLTTLLAGLLVAAAALLVTAPPSNAGLLPQYGTVAIGPVPGFDMSQTATINPMGIIAITSRVSSTGLQGASLSAGAGAALRLNPRPGDQHNNVVAVNERGDAIGSSAAIPTGNPRPVLYPAGSPTPTAVPSLPDDFVTTLTGISGDIMVGYSRSTATGPARPVFISNRPGEGFIVTNLGIPPGYVDGFPAAITANEKIVGFARTTGAIRAVEFKNGLPAVELGLLPLGVGSAATALNHSGQPVGFAWLADNNLHAVSFAGGVATPLGELPGHTKSIANAINNNGDVVGTSCTAANVCRAVLFTGGQVIDLNSVVPTGFELLNATGINDAGQIAATGKVSGAPRAIMLSAPIVTGITASKVIPSLPNLNAQLSSTTGPVPYAPVAFTTMNNKVLCIAITDIGGKAVCRNQFLTATLSLGYKVTFAGNAIYAPSSAKGALL